MSTNQKLVGSTPQIDCESSLNLLPGCTIGTVQNAELLSYERFDLSVNLRTRSPGDVLNNFTPGLINQVSSLRVGNVIHLTGKYEWTGTGAGAASDVVEMYGVSDNISTYSFPRMIQLFACNGLSMTNFYTPEVYIPTDDDKVIFDSVRWGTGDHQRLMKSDFDVSGNIEFIGTFLVPDGVGSGTPPV